ncbi:single-stranded-DNA-specific exonuclease RecJ [Cellulosilyticum sp. I15G10I2]|uniref:single-stranded-DNA-specific exonuclease RecJ n=1 Tax=Cellulosilyticum sp. I15G10I2 TaxID=1892843 RepID=UPI00085C0517|nr:single-stranded-DNA-specific exonuclease RecJ [Cellulosilyticum sp. I15G10I2]
MLPSTYKWKIDSDYTGVNLIEKILNNRGICGEDQIRKFLNPTSEGLHSPYLLNDMTKAVERIVQCRQDHKHIVIYGDYDVDGITSTSILYMFLKKAQYDVSYYIPNRQTEGYGLNKDAIAKISEYADLIITVDTGIAAVEELAFANTIGIDVIITDHHECQDDLPKGYCIINPKRKDSTYPFDALAGVGVTFKLIHALAIYDHIEEEIWEYIDLVALGTIADVVPLIHENRVITYLGFEAMQNTRNIGLRELIKVTREGDIKEKISSNMIAYQIAPRINAVGRLSDAKIGVELLTTEDEERAKSLARLLNEENKRRQDMEACIIEQAEEYIKNNIDISREKIVIVVGKEWHHGVIGIVASKIMSKYYRPTIVLTEEDGVLSGSARSIEGFNIFEVIHGTQAYLLRFGGHEMAAGLSLQAENLEIFRKLINQYADDLIDEEMLIPSIAIDLELSAKEVGLDFCEMLEKLEPFGAYNPVPLFCVRGKIQYIQTMGQSDQHLRLTVEQDNNALQAVGFYKGYLEEYLTIGEEVVVACEVIKNVWNNKVSVQLRLKDIQSTEEDMLKSRYYTSLYYYLKDPGKIKGTHVKLIKDSTSLERAKIINVYTEEGLRKVYGKFKNNSKNVNLGFKICYNKDCLKNSEVTILVNPLQASPDCVYYEWDYYTIDETMAVYDNAFIHHKNQLPKMIPSHKDCIAVYKLLKNHLLEYITIHKAVVSLSFYNMTEYKLFQILEIFKELGLLEYTFMDDSISYDLIASDKTRLENSLRYRNLQNFFGSILQIN